MKRRWRKAWDGGGPTADAVMDHPAPMGEYIGVDYLPTLMAPDPGGIGPHAASFELLVLSVDTPVQHSPITNWNPGSPYPGPPATVHHYVDMDSAKWWGRTGQGQLVWSNHTEQIGELPPMLPADLVQHVDTWQSLWAGYPSIARNRPAAFADQVPTFNP